MSEKVTLRVVYRNSIMADGSPVIEFRRSDTNERVSCVACESFTDRGECGRGIAHPWPLGSICCTDWEPRVSPYEMKKCADCSTTFPAYYTNRTHCSDLCKFVHENIK